MDKDPLLFIDSAQDGEFNTNSQKTFDSRKQNIKEYTFDKTLSRLLRFKQSGRLIICEFITKEEIYEGELIDYNNKKFIIFTGNKEVEIDINELIDLTILKV